MALKVLARNWKIEVEDGNTTSPGWTKVGGINTFTVSTGKEDADTTDFDSLGFAEHVVSGRSYEITFEGFFLEDATGVRNLGQSRIEGYAENVGATSVQKLRITTPSGKVTEYKGSFVVGDVGGGNNDSTSWGATMTVSGKPVKVA